MENTSVLTASNQADSNFGQNKNVETRGVENFKYGDFAQLRPKCDRNLQVYYTLTRKNVLQNSIAEFPTGQRQTRSQAI